MEGLLIFYLRPARRKARLAAAAEAISLLRDLAASAPIGGPLSEQGGLFWIALPTAGLDEARSRLPRLGYTDAVDLLEPVGASDGEASNGSDDARLVRWRRRMYRLVRVYEEDAAALRERAPDRRPFLLDTPAAGPRVVRGYRGDGGPLSRRGLPVYDARLLVNLVAGRPSATFLDPFAGIGGLVIEARDSGMDVWSADVDRVLRLGLKELGATHAVADAGALPFRSATFDAIATEPPYHDEAEGTVVAALGEMNRLLKLGGRVALLCAATQAPALRAWAAVLGLTPFLDTPIDRKGLEVVALAWEKTP